jgi:hypothetical protein
MTFQQLTINKAFVFVQPDDEPQLVCCKIDESRYIIIGENGAYSVQDRDCIVKEMN